MKKSDKMLHQLIKAMGGYKAVAATIRDEFVVAKPGSKRRAKILVLIQELLDK